MALAKVGSCICAFIPEDQNWLPILNTISYIALLCVVMLGIKCLRLHLSYDKFKIYAGSAIAVGLISFMFAQSISLRIQNAAVWRPV